MSKTDELAQELRLLREEIEAVLQALDRQSTPKQFNWKGYPLERRQAVVQYFRFHDGPAKRHIKEYGDFGMVAYLEGKSFQQTRQAFWVEHDEEFQQLRLRFGDRTAKFTIVARARQPELFDPAVKAARQKASAARTPEDEKRFEELRRKFGTKHARLVDAIGRMMPKRPKR